MKLLSFHSAVMGLLAISPAWAFAQQSNSPFSPPVAAEENLDPSAVPAQQDYEVLNRGPIHEAFADQILEDPAPSEVIPQQPPEPIEEIAPEVKPDEDAIWIPGYFAWSEVESDFIWVSGVWRVPPPGQRWTPGYWTETDGGYQWVAGFWTDAQAQSLNYLPYPPESLDTGPTSPAPGEDYYWVSGCWQWQTNQYTWQPGYWNVYRPGWTWIPSYYVWSPRGAIYCGGYWDYPFGRRGLLFAPVHYYRPIYRQPGYFYRPSYAIQPSSLLLHLFVNIGSRNLYFGDYYGSRYYDRGYRGWSHYHRHHSHLPSYVYYQHHFRNQGVDFGDRLNSWSQYYDRHPDYRPAHTVAESRRQAERFRDNASFSRQSVFVSTVSDLVNQNRSGRDSFRRIDDSDRGRIDRDRSEWAELRQRREQVEDRREALARADRNGRVEADGNRGGRPDGDRDQRPGASRPRLELPNYLSDPDRRAQVDRQMRELRSRIPDRAGEGRTDPTVGNRPSRSGSDRGDLLNRGNFDRGNIDRGNIDRGNFDRGNIDRGNNSDRGNPTRGDATPGNPNRGDNLDRGDRFNRDSNRPQGNVTPQRPVTQPRVQPRTERTLPNSSSLQDLIRERSRGESSPSRTVPTPQPRTEQPRIRTERPSIDPSRGRSIPSFDSNRSIRSPATSRPPSAAPSNSSRPAAIPSARSPVPSASQPRVSQPQRTSQPRVTTPRSQPRVSQPQRTSQPRVSPPQRSSRPTVTAPSRSRGGPSASSNRGGSSRGGGSARSSRGGGSKKD